MTKTKLGKAVKSEVVEAPVAAVKVESAAKKSLRAAIENLKVNNPAEYELNKQAIRNQLDAME